MPSEMNRFVAILAVSWLGTGTNGFAQTGQTAQTVPPPAPTRTESPRPGAAGEPWTALTLYEYVNAGDSQPHTRNRTQRAVCVVPGKFSLSNATSTDLPDEYRERCWVNDERTERNRAQVKYACNDGMTAEAATRRETDGSFSSKFVINIPGKGGVAVTRTFRRTAGVCDLSKVSPEVPISPLKAAPPAGK